MADGADPVDENTLMAAFGAAIMIPYDPEQPPHLEDVVRRLGIFYTCHSVTFDLPSHHAWDLLSHLLSEPNPVAIVATSLRASYGFCGQSTTIWSFDSHGTGAAGASARQWTSSTDIVAHVMASQVQARAWAQFFVFRPSRPRAAA